MLFSLSSKMAYLGERLCTHEKNVFSAVVGWSGLYMPIRMTVNSVA